MVFQFFHGKCCCPLSGFKSLLDVVVFFFFIELVGKMHCQRKQLCCCLTINALTNTVRNRNLNYPLMGVDLQF